jgi:hypothetical protein
MAIVGQFACPHPAEAGGVGRGAAAELQVVTLEEFLEVYDGYIGGKYLRGGGIRIPGLLRLRTGGSGSYQNLRFF